MKNKKIKYNSDFFISKQLFLPQEQQVLMTKVKVIVSTSGSWRHAWYDKFGVDLSRKLCHSISPPLPSRKFSRCSKSFSVTTSFSLTALALGLQKNGGIRKQLLLKGHACENNKAYLQI